MKHLIKNNLNRMLLFILFFAAGVFIVHCSESISPDNNQGEIKLLLVDKPAGYDQVNIVVKRVEVHKSGYDDNLGWFVINNSAATYDLMTLTNGASVVLGKNSLNAGQYTQIRLIIGTGSNVVVDGVFYPLEIPSGEQTGVKLNHTFEIQHGNLYELILDFDAERSIIYTGSGHYKLKPVIRVVPILISGTISGKINPAFAAGYVQAINGTDTAGTIAESINGTFKLMALLYGTYDVKIFSGVSIYNDTTITNVSVVEKQNTDLGTINLSVK